MQQLLHPGSVPAGPAPGPTTIPALSNLTAMEHTIARLVAQGLTNRQIAGRIDRSPHTVDSHLRNIFQKLGVNTRVALTRIVLGGDLPS